MSYTGTVELRNLLRLDLFDETLPTANSNLFEPITITEDLYDDMAWFDVAFCSSKEGILSLARTQESTTKVATLNSGEPIPASSLFTFTIPIPKGTTMSLVFSATTGKYEVTISERGGIS